jgi:hypothetical protein
MNVSDTFLGRIPRNGQAFFEVAMNSLPEQYGWIDTNAHQSWHICDTGMVRVVARTGGTSASTTSGDPQPRTGEIDGEPHPQKSTHDQSDDR